MSQVRMPPSSESGEPEEPAKVADGTAAETAAQASAAADGQGEVEAESVESSEHRALPEQQPEQAAPASNVPGPGSFEGSPAVAMVTQDAQVQTEDVQGPAVQWGPPTQPNHSRPHAGQNPQPAASAVAIMDPVQQSSAPRPSAMPAPQQAPMQWPQQSPQLQWPQQYPQPPMPQQPAQPQYPLAYPQTVAQPAGQPYPQPYPGYQQYGGVWPQSAQQQGQAPPYPGYPQSYPPAPQPGMTLPGNWPYVQPGYSQTAYAAPVVVPPPARSVVESGSTTGWQGDEKPKQALIWRVVKWPIKTLLKGIYVAVSAAKRHRVVAIVLLLVIALLAGGAYEVYQSTHPAPASTAATGGSSTGQPDTTPFTIVTGAQPPLSPGVITFLHGYKTFDGYQLWSSLSPGLQQVLQANGVSAAQLNSDLQQEKQAGITYSEFIYTGGFLSPDGSSHYTVEVVESLGSAKAVRTWFFMTDTNDKVINFQDLSPQSGQGG